MYVIGKVTKLQVYSLFPLWKIGSFLAQTQQSDILVLLTAKGHEMSMFSSDLVYKNPPYFENSGPNWSKLCSLAG